MDLADLIARNAAFHPEKPAIRFAGRDLTYAGFSERIEQAARGLKSQLGVERGDRVAILALNHPDYLVLLYACARLGALMVPINWRLAIPEQLYILQHCGAKALIIEDAFAGVMAPLKISKPDMAFVMLGEEFDALCIGGTGNGRNPHVDFQTPLLIVYTSGTTGRPKGAVLRQDAVLWNALNSQHMHALTADDHVLTVLPMFHVGALNIQTTPALQLGATVTLHARFAAEATLEAIAQDRPTLTVLVPSTMQAVIEHEGWAEADLSCLRAVSTGSTMVPVPLIDAFMDRGVPVLQVYGATETCPIAVYTRLGCPVEDRQSTGLPGLLCEAKVVDAAGAEVPPGTAGEVLVRGPNVFFEYWGDPAATEEALRDGWYHSGDIGTRSADGTFVIHDRKKNVIISGGENIYPAEIERVLLDHPDIAEAAVVGRPDPRWQEVPVAVIVKRPDCALSAEGVIGHLSSNLARFKVPRDIVFTDTLPRNAMGKVQHFRLRETLLNGKED